MDQLILIILILVGTAALTFVIVKLFDKKPTHEKTEAVTVKVVSKSDGSHTIPKIMRPGTKSMINDSSRAYPLTYGVINGKNVEDNNVLPRSYPTTYKLIVEYEGTLYDVDVSRAFYNETAVKQEVKMTVHRVYDANEGKIQQIYFTE